MSLSEGLGSWKRRALTRLWDRVKFSPATREVLAAAAHARSWVTASPDQPLRAYQRTAIPALRRSALRRLTTRLADPVLPDAALTARWARFVGSPELTRSIVLKAPGPDGEKGVLLLTAEYNWVKLLTAPEFARIEPRYTLLLSAGWSPLDYALLFLALRKVSGRVFVEPGNYGEVPRIEALSPRVTCLPTICSDWIDPAQFRPKPRAGRQTDLLMVANWAPFKRHWHLFSALRHLPRDLRVTLIGQPDGPFTLERVKRQARDFGVPQDIRYLDGLRVEQVYEAMCDSRAVVILSRQEGPCVAVTEALFADTPVGMLHDAHIGTRAYINPQTGVLFDHGRVADGIRRLVATDAPFRPREWAVEHVSCHASVGKWNRFLKAQALADGRPWSRDLTPFCWKPYTVYLRTGDRVAVEPAVRELQSLAPAVFGPNFLAPALDTPA